ncbi:MAG: phosphoribosyltransferase family protein, partial [Thiotrichaceae bacterium]
MNDEIIKLSWHEMDQLHRLAASKVEQANFCPDIVIGILRCGMVSAVHLAYILGIRKVGAIFAQTTPSDEVLVSKDIPPEIRIDFPREEIFGKRVLLVDTVMASGTTVSMSLEELAACNPSTIHTLI